MSAWVSHRRGWVYDWHLGLPVGYRRRWGLVIFAEYDGWFLGFYEVLS